MSKSYLSICSGIEAATVAWHPLGWAPIAFAEVEAFPSAVLRHHYPTVPNWGDITTFKDWPDATFDVLVGGTPCQSFSVAGLRAGLADPRGNLALTYLAILDRYRPAWCVWENVPGVLSSSGGRDFGAFLGGLGQLGYGFAYRVLDAQYFGVAQRRRRVFVVGCAGGWQRAAAVLFDGASLRGDSAPSRETREGIAPTIGGGPPFSRTGNERSEIDAYVTAPTIPSRSTAGGGLGTDFDCDGGLIASTGDISHCLNAGGMGRIDYETETLLAHSLRADGFDASEDGTGRGTPIILDDQGGSMMNVYTDGRVGTLRRETHGNHPIVAFSVKDHGADAGDIAPTLRSGGHDKSHANGGVMPAVAFHANMGGNDGGVHDDGTTPTVTTERRPAIAFDAPAMAVRRLTPVECERLQGFPDNYTLIPYRNKPAADGPRYKALGNSMAVPVMAWIGRRLAEVAVIESDDQPALGHAVGFGALAP